MIMKIYLFLLITMLICIGLTALFYNEYSRAENDTKYKKIIRSLARIFGIISVILTIAFYTYNIYILCIKYSERIIFILTTIWIILIPVLIILYILLGKKFKYFEVIRQIFIGISIIIIFFGVIIYGFFMLAIIFNGNNMILDGTKKMHKEYSYSIEIVEMEEVPYTNISGGRWYIRSAPSIAYYYDITTENGNHTTKILDGYKYYVEKDEDDKYLDNPHIKVYKIMQEYISFHGNEKSNFVTYEYTICVPQNSIYYEQ